MRVGELTRQTGASIRSLRYYKQEGLLPAHRRRANGYREFEPAAREQVQRIRAKLAIGLTLAEVRRLSPCSKSSGQRFRSVRLRLMRISGNLPRLLNGFTRSRRDGNGLWITWMPQMCQI